MISGIHHVTAIAGDPQRNLEFYAGVLGLRLVKVTINYDDPGTYHFYYGDGLGRPGTILTFFPSPGASRGRIGTGQVSAGASLLMDSVAAAYIGFSVFGAGKPNVIGTLFGSILMGVLLNGLTMMNVPYYAQDIIKGAILVGALALSHMQKK